MSRIMDGLSACIIIFGGLAVYCLVCPPEPSHRHHAHIEVRL